MQYSNWEAAFKAQANLMWVINEMSDEFTAEEIEDMIETIRILGDRLYQGWEVDRKRQRK